MDPGVTLAEAEEAIADERYVDAAYLLGEYKTWRGKGGYEPRTRTMFGDEIMGDKFANQLLEELEVVL